MECFSSEYKVKITYFNLNVRIGGEGGKLFSDVEGELKIEVGKKTFFSESGILLLELARDLLHWLKNTEGDFHYFSMDYEEGPILSFEVKESGWKLSGVWCESVFEGVNHNELLSGVRSFVFSLITDLKKNRVDCCELLNIFDDWKYS